MKKTKFSLLSLLVIVTIFSLTGLAAERLTAYVSLDEEVARSLINEFQKETKIQVDWVRLSTGEAVARIEAEKNNPQASIFLGGVGLNHIEAKNKGLTAPYASPNAKNVPTQFKDQEHYWCGLYVGPLCFVYNLERLKELNLPAPKSWADLIKPIYKGHIQMASPQTSGTSYNVITTMIYIFNRDENLAFNYLKELNKNINQYTKSGSAPGRAAAIGETPIALGYSHDQVKLIDQGYPLEIAFPSEGTGYEVASMSLVKGGPQMKTAQKLYDWVLSKKGGEILASYYLAVFADVPLKKGAKPLSEVEVVDQDDVWGGANKERLIDRWQNEVYGK